MGRHANRPDNTQQLLRILKRAQWQNSNNDFPFFGPETDPKNENPFVAAPLRDSLSRPLRSSSFGRNARWNLSLGSRFTDRKSKKKRKKKAKSRKLSAHGRSTISKIIDRTRAESRAQRSFRIHLATATAEIRKIDEWSQIRVACSIRIFQLHPPFFKLYFLKQVVTRKRAYPTRDCDNLPGPTYL